MDKLKITLITVFCLFIAIQSTCAQTGGDSQVGNYYKDISNFNMKDFINMDLGLLAYLPTKKHWNHISKNIKLIPIDSLRYIDSLDIRKQADTLYVKMYTQNYLYRCQNVYEISKNTKRKTDTLMISNILIDFKIKEFIDYADTFRKKDYTVDFVIKQNSDKFNKRIIIHKDFRNN